MTRSAEPKFVRQEDATEFLVDAMRAPPGSPLRQALLDGAVMTTYFGLLNEHRFQVRDDRRTLNRGTTGPTKDDTEAMRYMRDLSHITGERNPRELAVAAINAGKVELRATRESRIRRLIRRWKASPYF